MADDKDQFLFPELHQIIDESTLGLFIQIAAGFVQQDAGGITEQGAGQINLLLFTEGQVFRLDGHPFVSRWELKNGIQFLILCIRDSASADNVFLDSTCEDEVGIEKIAELRFFTGKAAGFMDPKMMIVPGK